MRRFAPDGPDTGRRRPMPAPVLPTAGRPAARQGPPRRPGTPAPPRDGASRPASLERLLRLFVAPPAAPPPAAAAPRTPAAGAEASATSPPAATWPAAAAVPSAVAGAGLPAAPAAAVAPAPRVVVLGRPEDVEAVARAVALRLAAGRRRSPGVVVSWSPGGTGDGMTPRAALGLPSRGGAARLAASLADRGHAARAAGRIVGVRLGEAPGAVAEAERVRDAAPEVPVVLALGGARGPEWDRLLAAHDLVLLAVGPTVPPALVEVALAGARGTRGTFTAAGSGTATAAGSGAGAGSGARAMAVTVSAGRRPRPSREHLAAALSTLATA